MKKKKNQATLNTRDNVKVQNCSDQLLQNVLTVYNGNITIFISVVRYGSKMRIVKKSIANIRSLFAVVTCAVLWMLITIRSQFLKNLTLVHQFLCFTVKFEALQ